MDCPILKDFVCVRKEFLRQYREILFSLNTDCTYPYDFDGCPYYGAHIAMKTYIASAEAIEYKEFISTNPKTCRYDLDGSLVDDS